MELELQLQGFDITAHANLRDKVLNTQDELSRFLAASERRALRLAEFAVSNRDDAMELVQESMLKLAQKYADRPAAEWPLLFHRILQSRIRDFYRRQTVRRRVFFWQDRSSLEAGEDYDPIQTAPDPNGVDPAAQLDADRFKPALNKALSKLPLRQQQAFLLRVWEGFDVRQTARVMDCSEGSVKTHHSRALQSLRKQLANFKQFL